MTINWSPEEIEGIFSEIKDYRQKPVSYAISEVLFTTIIGITVGCTTWQDISDFGDAAIETLRKYLPYINGVPPAQTLARIINWEVPPMVRTKSYQK